MGSLGSLQRLNQILMDYHQIVETHFEALSFKILLRLRVVWLEHLEEFTQDLVVSLLRCVNESLLLQKVIVKIQEWKLVLNLVILITPVYLG